MLREAILTLNEKKIFVFIGKNKKKLFVRITKGSPKKLKKFFNRVYGPSNDSAKKLMKAGLKEGLNEISLKEFLELTENLSTRRERIMKKIDKMIKNSEISSLEDIPSDIGRKFLGEIRAKLMKLNHKYLKKHDIKDFSSFDFSVLPIQGFKEKEIIKFLDN